MLDCCFVLSCRMQAKLTVKADDEPDIEDFFDAELFIDKRCSLSDYYVFLHSVVIESSV